MVSDCCKTVEGLHTLQDGPNFFLELGFRSLKVAATGMAVSVNNWMYDISQRLAK